MCYMREMELKGNTYECMCQASEYFQYWTLGSVKEDQLPWHQKYGCATTTHCSTLQRTATRCNALQHTMQALIHSETTINFLCIMKGS